MNRLAFSGKLVLMVSLQLMAITGLYAQKQKFKDIYPFLSTRRYEEVEPILKKYLLEHNDEPKAHMYMGFIYQEKALKDDVLKATRLCVLHCDSAILFLDMANKTMTEKEIKRNDEYYQIYNRRDLRTGEFGVKLSDIQYDLQKRIEAMRERSDRVKMVKYYFTLTDSMYRKANRNYRNLQAKYPGTRELLLRADESILTQLTAIRQQYDSASKAFENYRSSISLLGKTGYSPTATVKEIAELSTDGASGVDFFQNELELWNYGKFAEKTREILEQDIFPMHQHLIEYDMAINKLRERSMRDSVSVRSDLTKLIDKMLMEKLQRYDPKPMPMEVFNLKIAELEFNSVLMENRPHRDSADLYLQRKLVTSELHFANRLDSVARKFNKIDLDQEVQNYASFVRDTYGTLSTLKSFGHAMEGTAAKEIERRQAKLKQIEESLKWVRTATDSIPLFELSGYRTRSLVIVPDKWVTALVFTDSVTTTGWLHSLTPTRKPGLSFSFALNGAVFKKSVAGQLGGLLFTDPNGQLFFTSVFKTMPDATGNYLTSISKIYRTDGLAWTSDFPLSFQPTELVYRADTGELTIKGTTNSVVIDKNGKLK